MALTMNDMDRFKASMPRLEAIAYRLLGSASDAEDAVQDTFLRWQATDTGRIEVPEAWLTKVLTNLCLNQLTSARARRETYVGQWLPEPLLAGDPMLGPRTPPNSASPSRTRSSPSWNAWPPTSGWCTCCARPSATRTGGSRRSWTSARPPVSRSSTAPRSTSRKAGHAPRSTRPPRGASSTNSSRLPPAAAPNRSSSCSPPTPSRSATAEGRSRHAPRPSRAPSPSRSSCGACSSPVRPSAPLRAVPRGLRHDRQQRPRTRGGPRRPGHRCRVHGDRIRRHRRPPQPGQPGQARARDPAMGRLRPRGAPARHLLTAERGRSARRPARRPPCEVLHTAALSGNGGLPGSRGEPA